MQFLNPGPIRGAAKELALLEIERLFQQGVQKKNMSAIKQKVIANTYYVAHYHIYFSLPYFLFSVLVSSIANFGLFTLGVYTAVSIVTIGF